MFLRSRPVVKLFKQAPRLTLFRYFSIVTPSCPPLPLPSVLCFSSDCFFWPSLSEISKRCRIKQNNNNNNNNSVDVDKIISSTSKRYLNLENDDDTTELNERKEKNDNNNNDNAEILFERCALVCPNSKLRDNGPERHIDLARLASSHGIEVFFMPDKTDFKMTNYELPPGPWSIGVVTSFGYMIPNRIIQEFKLGVYNVHPSNLPLYRGSSPIQTCLYMGDARTNVCIMLLSSIMDGGDVVLREHVSVHLHDTFLTLSPRLAKIGSKLLMDVLRRVVEKETEKEQKKTRNENEEKEGRREEVVRLETTKQMHVDKIKNSSDGADDDEYNAFVRDCGLFSLSEIKDRAFVREELKKRLLARKIEKKRGCLSFTQQTGPEILRVYRSLYGYLPLFSFFNGVRVILHDLVLVSDDDEQAHREHQHTTPGMIRVVPMRVPVSSSASSSASSLSSSSSSSSSFSSSSFSCSSSSSSSSSSSLSSCSSLSRVIVRCVDGCLISIGGFHVSFRRRQVSADEFARGYLNHDKDNQKTKTSEKENDKVKWTLD